MDDLARVTGAIQGDGAPFVLFGCQVRWIPFIARDKLGFCVPALLFGFGLLGPPGRDGISSSSVVVEERWPSEYTSSAIFSTPKGAVTFRNEPLVFSALDISSSPRPEPKNLPRFTPALASFAGCTLPPRANWQMCLCCVSHRRVGTFSRSGQLDTRGFQLPLRTLETILHFWTEALHVS